ncbi:ribosomal protein S6 modification protein [Polaribacter pacificus]|uniref:Ribosomal protein S6 modification protein n=1 Tax=Polaribacter pacificus TaxID=1775173 RepID=A0A917MDZ5_9FLAO|nr:RimK/LysX family protein [Polaribacter pacificus]GGH00883.1 ribosomal protein S6 modification protein [Polaribacter pacificus]
MSKKLIGRFDKIDFPEFNLFEIEAKTDTGAFTSSIHSHKIEEFTVDDQNFIKFTLLDPTHIHYNEKVYQTKNYSKKLVKSSNGLSEERFVIKTTVVLFNEIYPIELTLSERSDMKYPILLGRKFLNNKFIVDPSIKNSSFKSKKSS